MLPLLSPLIRMAVGRSVSRREKCRKVKWLAGQTLERRNTSLPALGYGERRYRIAPPGSEPLRERTVRLQSKGCRAGRTHLGGADKAGCHHL